uniref:Uncharacterized protein n=1 Tax=Proboscia inermis TaxID=420281 RepID=A0A7S0C7Q5_9STRA
MKKEMGSTKHDEEEMCIFQKHKLTRLYFQHGAFLYGVVSDIRLHLWLLECFKKCWIMFGDGGFKYHKLYLTFLWLILILIKKVLSPLSVTPVLFLFFTQSN